MHRTAMLKWLGYLIIFIFIQSCVSNSNKTTTLITPEQDSLFAQAVSAIKSADVQKIKELVIANPYLTNSRSTIVIDNIPQTHSLLHILTAANIDAKKQVAIAKILVNAGADVNARIHYNRGDTPLHTAARSNAADVIEFLANRDALLEATSKTKHNSTPLAIAVKYGNAQAANTLHRFGANVYSLPIAAGIGRVDLINEFFVAGRMTPAAAITHPNHAPAFRLSSREIKNIYRQAVEFALLNEKFEVADRFLQSGININGQWGEHQATLLHLVAQKGSPAMAEYLLQRGANITIKDNQFGQTASQWAVRYKNKTVAAFLETQSKQ